MHTNSRLTSAPASGADRIVLLIAIGLLASTTFTLRAGEIYKSVDAEGHVVYSDQPDASAADQETVDIDSSDPDADIDVQSSEAPPSLPDDEQPDCPDEGYLWTPGYWYWNAAGYYWIRGAWVQPPRRGVLWTPGYWEYVNALYVFHAGYWADHVGYYGGINYGFGYFGVGFSGGRWVNRSFAYNRSVTNIDARVIHSTYSEPVDHHPAVNRVSYNGGPGGTVSVMTAPEKALAAQLHFAPTSVQRRYVVQSARTPALIPHMPASVYQSERNADHRDIDGAENPAVRNAPALAAPRATVAASLDHQHELARAPRTSRVAAKATVAAPSKPASKPPALSKPQLAMPYPKS